MVRQQTECEVAIFSHVHQKQIRREILVSHRVGLSLLREVAADMLWFAYKPKLHKYGPNQT